MEVALFGHRKRLRAMSRKVGALGEAHGGILYLDEVADMPRAPRARYSGAGRSAVERLAAPSGKVDVRILSSTAPQS